MSILICRKESPVIVSGETMYQAWILYVDFAYGLVFVSVWDYPNEADTVVLSAWGVGWWKFMESWIVPWKIKRVSI